MQRRMKSTPSRRPIDPRKADSLVADVNETAHLIGVSASTLYVMIRRGEGPPNFVLGGRRLFPRDGIKTWIAERVKDAK